MGLLPASVARPRPAGPGQPQGPTASTRFRRGLSNARTGWCFIGPATLIIIGLSAFPAGWAFHISQLKWDGIRRQPRQRQDAPPDRRRAWNDLIWPLITISEESRYTIQLGLANFQGTRRT